jgi:hypothetical protein
MHRMALDVAIDGSKIALSEYIAAAHGPRGDKPDNETSDIA